MQEEEGQDCALPMSSKREEVPLIKDFKRSEDAVLHRRALNVPRSPAAFTTLLPGSYRPDTEPKPPHYRPPRCSPRPVTTKGARDHEVDDISGGDSWGARICASRH